MSTKLAPDDWYTDEEEYTVTGYIREHQTILKPSSHMLFQNIPDGVLSLGVLYYCLRPCKFGKEVREEVIEELTRDWLLFRNGMAPISMFILELKNGKLNRELNNRKKFMCKFISDAIDQDKVSDWFIQYHNYYLNIYC